MKRPGILYIISAPSGAGKTTLCRELLDIFPELRHSISFTTRKARPGEVEGKDYFFVDREHFLRMAENGEFAEWAEVHGNLYGTSLKTLEESRVDGIDLILDIDCQGAAKLKESQAQGVNIFILPPSFSELKRRLESRNSDSKEVIDKRVTNAASEIPEARWYDYIIINDQFSKAVEELKSIIIAERHRTSVVIDCIDAEFNIN
ncbi:MAG TPA: guanylate kinase [Geobacteraceae bacterium]|nr:guanylate kinase [Geobacteraceae bacterium]